MDRDRFSPPPKSPAGSVIIAPSSPRPGDLSRKSSMRSTSGAKKLRHEGRECTRENARDMSRSTSAASNHSVATSPDSQHPDSAERLRPSFATHTFASHRRTQSTLSESKHPRLHRSNSSITSMRGYTPETPRDSPRLLRSKTTTPITTASARIQNALLADRSPGMRQPIGLAEAFQLAQQQEVVNSPLLDDTIDLIEAFQRANAEYNGGRFQGSPSPAPRTLRLKDGSPIAINADAFLTNSKDGRDLAKRLQEFDPRQQLARRVSAGVATGLSPIPANKPLEAYSNAADQTADEPDYDPEARENMRSTTPTADRSRVSAQWSGDRRDHPLPSIEDDEDEFEEERPAPARHTASWSPEKSMNWNLEAEFTAGDLQISDSPRVTNTRGRTSMPSYALQGSSFTPNGNSDLRRSNDRLDRIRDREAEIAGMSFAERAATKLDEIRARERQTESPRTVANSKLDEIRARNSEARSASPEMMRRSLQDDLEDPAWPMKPTRSMDALVSDDIARDEQQPAKPVDEDTAFKTRIQERSLRRHDSHELLRRLSQTTSAAPSRRGSLVVAPATNGVEIRSPVKEEEEDEAEEPKQAEAEVATEEPGQSAIKSAFEEAKAQIRDGKAFKDRPAMGPAGIRRAQSTDSIRDKRSSAGSSEGGDPTDRIEAEMSLFAPLDNLSERGSARASSRGPSDTADEDTPRAARVDPLTMPTPRVTGAYVETPMTLRVNGIRKASKEGGPWRLLALKAKSPLVKSPRDPRIPAGLQRRSSSMPSLRRARSRSRSRGPVINTAKKVSVKDDLRAIMKEQQIEDSTLDEFDGVLEKTECDEDELEQEVNSTLLKVEDKSVVWDSSDRDRELEQLERVLHSIRDSKQGIARLEDKVAHSDKAASNSRPRSVKEESVPPEDISTIKIMPASTDNVVLSVPRLLERGSSRPTKFGFCLLVLGSWLMLESMFTRSFSAPQYACTTETPCEWSPNEPYFPYTMPFMLDEWTTGGQGRSLVWKIGENLGDTVADVSDWITRTDFSQQDQRYMGVWERKRHRRRLRKHGLIPKWVEPPTYKGKYAAWHAASAAAAASSDGYEYQVDDEKMDADEMI